MRQYKSTDRATGIVYVYEGERFWDKEKKQANLRLSFPEKIFSKTS